MNMQDTHNNSQHFKRLNDSTCGIQAAINALPPEGGCVELPAGTYVLRRSIRLRDNVRLCGAGPGTILTRPRIVKCGLARSIRKGDKTISLKKTRGLKLGDELCVGSTEEGGWWARHGIITDLDTKKNRVSLKLLDCPKDHTCELRHNAFAANWFPALWVPYARNVTIERLAIEGNVKKHRNPSANFTVAAVHTRDSVNLRIQDINIQNWPADGIGVQGGSNAIVRGCIVENSCGPGFHPGTSLIDSSWIDNISHHNTGDGLYFCLNVKHAVCRGNQFHHNRMNGIGGLSDPDSYNVVEGNICSFNRKCGIDAPNAAGNTIQNNLLRNNSQEKAGRYPAIFLSHHRNNIVRNNLCIDDQTHPTQTEAVSALDPAGSNMIADNPCFITPSKVKKQ